VSSPILRGWPRLFDTTGIISDVRKLHEAAAGSPCDDDWRCVAAADITATPGSTSISIQPLN
jgi:hypothetical protein